MYQSIKKIIKKITNLNKNLIGLIIWTLFFAFYRCNKAHQKAIDCCQQYVHYTHELFCHLSINNALKTIHGINTQKTYK